MATSPLSQNTIELKARQQSIQNKTHFWYSYLTDILPPQYTIAHIDDDGKAQYRTPQPKRGTDTVRIHIQLNDQTIMRGIIHTSKAKFNAWQTVMVEQQLDSRRPENSTFFTLDKAISFHDWDNGEWKWEKYRAPKKIFDPIENVEEVRKVFLGALEVRPMEREGYDAWESEVGIDDESMARNDKESMMNEFVPVQDWPKEWFR